jgi:hypothetical protein
MFWQDCLRGDPLPWLLEKDDPGVRYLAQRDLLGLAQDDTELQSARRTAHKEGPIAEVLKQVDEEGYWINPGPGYNPKYRSSVWSIILLAQLGAQIKEDSRIIKACGYILDHALTSGGQFSLTGSPSGTVDCLQGNLCWALLEMGYEDPRLTKAFEWMARSVTGEGVASVTEKQADVRYYAGKCGPNFVCGANNNLSCAWGAVKVMLAFSQLPQQLRTSLIKNAIKQGVNFLFSVDPADAEYPCGYNDKPSRNWWRFGFPVFYVTDLLQNVEALVKHGYGFDPRLERSFQIILEKQDPQGRWPLEYDYTGKTWVDFGPKKHPNKWVTLRALKVLKSR